MSSPYLNGKGYEVPENKILVVPFDTNSDGHYKDIIQPLKGNPKRNWFTPHFYYCLPLNIGNQYGFIIKSLVDFEMTWDGSEGYGKDISFKFLNRPEENKQIIKSGFGSGIVTIQNMFSLKTPPGINLMTIQPPNMFIPGCVAMTGVIECDQIRRDFTFNIKITIPNMTIKVKKGDALGAFIPIPRYFVDKFDVDFVGNHFEKDIWIKEIEETMNLSKERIGPDTQKPHQSGRRYFNGIHSDNTKYIDHQKRL